MTKPKTKPKTKPETKPETEPKTELQAEPETELKAEPRTELKTEPQKNLQAHLQPHSQKLPRDRADLNAPSDLASETAMDMDALQGPVLRSDRVAQIQQSIATGRYRIASADVADKIIHSWLYPGPSYGLSTGLSPGSASISRRKPSKADMMPVTGF